MLATIDTRGRRLFRRRGFDVSDLARPDLVLEECPCSRASAAHRSRVASRSGPARARASPSGGRAGRAVDAVERAAARAHRRLRSAGERRRTRGRSRAPGTAIPVSASPGCGGGPAPAHGRRPRPPHAEGALGRRTRHLIFEPLELLEKLAAITPRPRMNLVLSHGVLAPHARWRARRGLRGDARGGSSSEPSPRRPQ